MDSIVFDLDGTLWDTCEPVAIAWNRVLQRNRISFREITPEEIRKVTGLTHEMCIRKVFAGLAEETIQLLIRETEREDTIVIADMGGKLYAGVKSTISELAKKFPLFIVSNCQSGYVETFISRMGFEGLFKDFECWGNTKQPKSENLRLLMKRQGLMSPVYVGDTEGDEKAARDNHVPFWFVSYGFGVSTQYERKIDEFNQILTLS